MSGPEAYALAMWFLVAAFFVAVVLAAWVKKGR